MLTLCDGTFQDVTLEEMVTSNLLYSAAVNKNILLVVEVCWVVHKYTNRYIIKYHSSSVNLDDRSLLELKVPVLK